MGLLEKPKAKTILKIYLHPTTMTKKDCCLPHTKAFTMDGATKGKDLEQTGKGLQKGEAGTSVDVSRDKSTTGGSSKDRALVSTSRYRFLVHAVWAVIAGLLVIYAVDQIKLPSTAKLRSSESPAREKNDAATFPKSLSQETDRSSSLTTTRTIYFETCTHSPLSSLKSSVREKDDTATFAKSVSRETDSSSPRTSYPATDCTAACALPPHCMSLISLVPSACACLTLTSRVDDGPVTVTVVRKGPRNTPIVPIC